ncbi:low molecular weight protein-tyrosine-phosphatase [Novosphingobium sp. 9]|uniref:low molecular weight protein-tyrosine-phosphatase n=1 Tax=Novosphingobium sp. 9 TaxID=2025349 RepID=UPI0021B53EAD|nr:low molecular weight protein-tyrosine-phosphatase [Novosphingobium sp. 9]
MANPVPAVLFVCLGNICRSPLAEAAMQHEALAARLTLDIDSAGTGAWHVGNPPDPRSIAEAARHGIDISHYAARQVTTEDFHRFDHIVALDRSNLANLQRLAPDDGTANLSMLMDHVPGMAGRDVNDPYYGEPRDFARTWREVLAGARGLLGKLA